MKKLIVFIVLTGFLIGASVVGADSRNYSSRPLEQPSLSPGAINYIQVNADCLQNYLKQK